MLANVRLTCQRYTDEEKSIVIKNVVTVWREPDGSIKDFAFCFLKHHLVNDIRVEGNKGSSIKDEGIGTIPIDRSGTMV